MQEVAGGGKEGLGRRGEGEERERVVIWTKETIILIKLTSFSSNRSSGRVHNGSSFQSGVHMHRDMDIFTCSHTHTHHAYLCNKVKSEKTMGHICISCTHTCLHFAHNCVYIVAAIEC